MGEIFALLFAGLLTPAMPFAAGTLPTLFPPAQIFAVTAPALSLPPHFAPHITATSGLIADVASGEVLWSKAATEKRPIASLTKLMTALIILEKHRLSEVVTIPTAAAQTEGAKMFLVAGERITVGDLMAGLLIPSANDAAVALAIFHSGSEADFVEEMNRRAFFLDMKNTHFANEHGLDADNNFSTAHDLVLLTRAVLQFSTARKLVSTIHTSVSSVDGKFQHDLNTTNELLSSAFPVFGVKTGTTDLAGQCLITLLRTRNHELLIIALGSQDRFLDTKTLFLPFL